MVLKLEVTLEEANVILSALAKQPFEVVNTLISNIQQQAKQQLSEDSKE